MALLSPDLVRTLNSQESWVSGPEAEPARARVESTLADLPASIRDLVLDELIDAPDRARGLLQGIALAATAGAVPEGVQDERTVTLRDAEGQTFALTALAWSTNAHPNGEPADVARLTQALDATFQGRQYALYLRRPIPSGFNAGPVSRAVHLWLAAIDRGEWKGRHAIYEDEDVALELTLVQQHAARGGGRLMTVGPVTALERLAAVDAMVVDLAQRHGRHDNGLPLIVALAAYPAWRVPRGYVEQLLYGTADSVLAVSSMDGDAAIGRYEARFRPNGRSLFSDPICRALSALWWVESAPAGDDPLAYRGWAHDNPWCEAPARIPPVDVPRFVVQGVDRDQPSLAWTRPPPWGRSGRRS